MSKKCIQTSKNRYFTFMVVPHNAQGDVYTFRMPKWVSYILVLAILAGVAFVSSSVVYTSSLSRRLLHYRMTLQVNEEQKRQIDYFSQETLQAKRAISELIDRDNELRKLLGISIKKPKVDLSGVIASNERMKFSDIDSYTGEKINKVSTDIVKIKEGIGERKESLDVLREKVKYIRSRFAQTPSVWPAYGRIVSGFGYRYSPWRGFHTGLDIASWYGAPVRASANGVITYSGWRGGYGKAVMIDHGYGMVSLYGHNSRLVVSVGQRVKKGQIISYVGATGLATGPHVHYEVRRSGYLANPISYLNLDIFTASKIWNKENK